MHANANYVDAFKNIYNVLCSRGSRGFLETSETPLKPPLQTDTQIDKHGNYHNPHGA